MTFWHDDPPPKGYEDPWSKEIRVKDNLRHKYLRMVITTIVVTAVVVFLIYFGGNSK